MTRRGRGAALALVALLACLGLAWLASSPDPGAPSVAAVTSVESVASEPERLLPPPGPTTSAAADTEAADTEAADTEAVDEAFDEAVDEAVDEGGAGDPLPDEPSPEVRIVRGRVVDLEGRPVAGATVSLVRRAQLDASTERNVGPPELRGISALLGPVVVVGQVMSGEDGVFEVRPEVMPPPEELGVAARLERGKDVRFGRLKGDAGQIVDETIELGDVQLSSRVQELVVRVRARGGVVPGARVQLFQGGDAFVSAFAAMTDAGGEARLEVAPDHLTSMAVSAEGHATHLRVLVEEGEIPPLVEVELTPGATIAGRVVDRSGAPIPDITLQAQVIAETTTARGKLAIEWNPDHEIIAITDPAGRFRLPGLRPGQAVVLFVNAPVSLLGDDVEVVAPANDVEIVLRPAGRLVVELTISAEGLLALEHRAYPLREILSLIALEPEGPGRALAFPRKTYADLHITFEQLPPGRYRVVSDLTAPLHPTFSGDVDVRPGTDTALRLELVEGRTVSGRLLDRDGRPIVGVDVGRSYTDDQTTWPSSDRTDHEGRFRISRAPNVAFRVHFYGYDPVEVRAGTGELTLPDVVVTRADEAR